MEAPLGRVIRYVNLGYSAERVAELMDWPLDKVRAIKGVPSPEAAFRSRYSNSTPEQRARAVELVASGESFKTVSKVIGVTVGCVAGAVHRAKIQQQIDRTSVRSPSPSA